MKVNNLKVPFLGFLSVLRSVALNASISSKELERQIDSGYYERYMLSKEKLLPEPIIPGITFGISIPFVINLSIKKVFPVLYSIP